MVLSRRQTIFRVGTAIKVIAPSVVKNPTTFAEQFAAKFRQNARPTIRERLLGSTTEKPFIYGTYTLAGTSAVAFGMLCCYGLTSSKKMNDADGSLLWPRYVRQRMHQTYAYLSGGLAISAAVGIASARSTLFMSIVKRRIAMALPGSLTLAMLTFQMSQAIQYENKLMKHVAFAAHCGIVGAIIAPVTLLGGPMLFRFAWYSAGIIGGLSATVICAASEEFLNKAAPFMMSLGVVFVSNVGTFFFPAGSNLSIRLGSIFVYSSLILLSAFLLYDTQRVKNMAERMPPPINSTNNQLQKTRAFDPINAQTSIYMTIPNTIFLNAVLLAGENGRGGR